MDAYHASKFGKEGYLASQALVHFRGRQAVAYPFVVALDKQGYVSVSPLAFLSRNLDFHMQCQQYATTMTKE